MIPIIAKLATLIFGYIRYKDKEAQNNGAQAENSSVADDDAHQNDDGDDINDRQRGSQCGNDECKMKNDAERPAYISYFDPIVEYYTRAPNAKEWQSRS